jgi:CDP-diacylglycerol--glycerol-3-phosphate 3-phosphatidyltransferase
MEKVHVEKAHLPQKKERPPRYETFTDWARDAAGGFLLPIARFLARFGFRPNTITLIGVALSGVVGLLLAAGHLMLGGWVLAVVAPIDAIDGALARALGCKSTFGAFLDSTLDRISDMFLLGGLLIHFLVRGMVTEVVLALVALGGSLMVSYIRSRAETLGFSCKVGLFTRLERVFVLAAGLIVGLPTLTLWVLAVGSVLTAIHRILHVYAQSKMLEERY